MLCKNKVAKIVEEYENQMREIKEENKKYFKKLEDYKKESNKEIFDEILIIYKVNPSIFIF